MKYLTLEKALEAWLQLQPLTEDDRNRLSRRFTIDFKAFSKVKYFIIPIYFIQIVAK